MEKLLNIDSYEMRVKLIIYLKKRINIIKNVI